MTARKPARAAAEKPVKLADSAGQTPRKTASKPARKAAESAPKPVKLVRKGRKPTAGAKLVREMAGTKDSFERKTLITQAGRLADRLEVIARLLDGDPGAWQQVKIPGQVAIANVVVTDVVREERQLSEVLRKLMMDIQKLGGDDPKSAGPKVDRLAEIVAGHYGGRKRA